MRLTVLGNHAPQPPSSWSKLFSGRACSCNCLDTGSYHHPLFKKSSKFNILRKLSLLREFQYSASPNPSVLSTAHPLPHKWLESVPGRKHAFDPKRNPQNITKTNYSSFQNPRRPINPHLVLYSHKPFLQITIRHPRTDSLNSLRQNFPHRARAPTTEMAMARCHPQP